MTRLSTKLDFFSFVSFFSLWLLEKTVMENIFEVVQAIVFGLLVATFLLNTNRVLKAMELCRECLILLNNKALNKEEEFLKKLRIPIYSVIFKGYDINKSDLTSAIECGSKLLVLLSECDRKDEEGKVSLKLAQLYQCQGKYKEASELLQKSAHPHDRKWRQIWRRSMLRKPRNCLLFYE